MGGGDAETIAAARPGVGTIDVTGAAAGGPGPSDWLRVLDHARYVPRSVQAHGVLPAQGVVALFPEKRKVAGVRRPIHTVELSSCQGQTDLLCSSKVQQPDRLTSDLHRPDTTRWPAPATFIDLHATSYGSDDHRRPANAGSPRHDLASGRRDQGQ